MMDAKHEIAEDRAWAREIAIVLTVLATSALLWLAVSRM